MSSGRVSGDVKELARDIFHNKVVDLLGSGAAPSEDFIDSCMASGLSAGETVRTWMNRFS